MPRKECVDPFERHKTKVSKNIRPVNKQFVAEVNDASRLKEGDYLCLNCRLRLTDDPKSLQNFGSPPSSVAASTQDGQQSASSVLKPSADDLNVSFSEPEVNTSLSDVEVNRELTEEVLPLLGMSPLAASKFPLYHLFDHKYIQ